MPFCLLVTLTQVVVRESGLIALPPNPPGRFLTQRGCETHPHLTVAAAAVHQKCAHARLLHIWSASSAETRNSSCEAPLLAERIVERHIVAPPALDFYEAAGGRNLHETPIKQSLSR